MIVTKYGKYKAGDIVRSTRNIAISYELLYYEKSFGCWKARHVLTKGREFWLQEDLFIPDTKIVKDLYDDI